MKRLWLLCLSIPAMADSSLTLLGDAAMVGGRLRLTPARRQTSGGAWLLNKQRVRDGFDASFEFQLTESGGPSRGADGFAFILQDAGPDALAGPGGAAGFMLGGGYGHRDQPGIPDSIAVFFDTHRNEHDPSDNYIAVCTNGKPKRMKWPPARLAVTRKLPVVLKDGRVHAVRISWRPPVLSVEVDHTPVLKTAMDIRPVTDEDGTAWVGFTAATGNGWQNHDILNWRIESVNSAMVYSEISYQLMDCAEGRNLCTPRRSVADEVSPGVFHVVLPAHLEVAIPNPANRPVVIENPRGMICHDVANRGNEGCRGIEALRQETRGDRTHFSVAPARDNEGFLEFTARTR